MIKSTEKKWCVLVAPGVKDEGGGYVECEAVFCYNETDYNPAVAWRADEPYSSAYQCVDNPDFRFVQHILEWGLPERARMAGSLISVDLDNYRIIEVKQTIRTEETHRVVELVR